MQRLPGRRTLLQSIALAAAGLGLGARAEAASDAPLTQPGAGALRELMDKLAAAPRRRDFKSVPMILTSPDQWDDAAIKLVVAARAEPRQVWNNYDLGGYWLSVMRNSLNTQIWGFGHPEFLVVSMTHGSAGVALYDEATWDKYQIGALLKALGTPKAEKFATNTLLKEPSGDPKDFEAPHGLYAMGDGDSIPLLMRRGVVFMACHNAVWGHAGALLRQGHNPDKLSQEQLTAELTNHLIPGTVLTPGAVGTLPELQKAGFVYANI